MALREWLIVLGLLLLVVIIVDGVRRYRRQKQIPQLNQNYSLGDLDEIKQKQVAWELPNGGARVVKSARVQSPNAFTSTFERRGMKTRLTATESEIEQKSPTKSVIGQKTTQVKEKTPSIVDDEYTDKVGCKAEHVVEHFEFEENITLDSLNSETKQRKESAFVEEIADPRFQGLFSFFKRSKGIRNKLIKTNKITRNNKLDKKQDMKYKNVANNNNQQRTNKNHETIPQELAIHDLANESNDPLFKTTLDEAPETENLLFNSQVNSNSIKRHPLIERAWQKSSNSNIVKNKLAQTQDWVIINAIADPARPYQGLDLIRLLLACGLQYDIASQFFYRFETVDNESSLQFAVINSFKPGCFTLDIFEQFATNGLTFIQPLPSAEHLLSAFDAMLETARVLVRNLKGELRDEQHCALTMQTIAFSRRRVQEFARRQHLYSSH